jgi:methionyl-tRNA formyltransferase
MRIVFLGTPEFAATSLEALIAAGFQVAGVVTAPDRPAGRGQKIQSPAVKQVAVKHGIPVLQPLKLKDPEFTAALRSLNADLQIVVAFRMLPETVWEMPRYGTYNLHASLLPKYRGAAPIQHAIMNGESETGVCTFKLAHAVDTGKLLLCEKVTIGEDTTGGELHDELMMVGAGLLVRTVRKIEESVNGGEPLLFVDQDESKVSHAPKISRETCRISWTVSRVRVRNLVRALAPSPGAFTMLMENGKSSQLKIFACILDDEKSEGEPGSIIIKGQEALLARGADGWLRIGEVQAEGKSRMGIQDFLRGRKIAENAHFE